MIFENLLYSNDRELTRDEERALVVDFRQRYPHLDKRKNKDEFIAQLLADHYFNSLKVKFGYAITCHKSQGGEWRDVFVDMRYAGSIQSETYYRWAYTAVTRSRETLYIVNRPEKLAAYSLEALDDILDLWLEQLLLACAGRGFEVIDHVVKDHQIQWFIRTEGGRQFVLHQYFNKQFIVSKIMYRNPETVTLTEAEHLAITEVCASVFGVSPPWQAGHAFLGAENEPEKRTAADNEGRERTLVERVHERVVELWSSLDNVTFRDINHGVQCNATCEGQVVKFNVFMKRDKGISSVVMQHGAHLAPQGFTDNLKGKMS
jgi:hypothetical protein